MPSLNVDVEPEVVHVEVSDDQLTAHLADGRIISAPLEWYPRLQHGSPDERARYELSGMGTGIHWPDLDEDLSIVGILAGRRSGESERSFRRWLEARSRTDHG